MMKKILLLLGIIALLFGVGIGVAYADEEIVEQEQEEVNDPYIYINKDELTQTIIDVVNGSSSVERVVNSPIFTIGSTTFSLVTLLSLVISLCKNKNKEFNYTKALKEVMARYDIKLNEEYTAKLDDLSNKLSTKVDEICETVTKKLNLVDTIKSKEIEKIASEIDNQIKDIIKDLEE